jgi:predicted metalloprotease
MRWTSRGRSRDLEDRRGQGGFRRAAPIGVGGLLILVVLSLITGQDFLSQADPGGGALDTSTAEPYTPTAEEEKLVDFVSFVLDDSQDVWTQLLGPNYQRARLVLFTDAVESACGFAQSATGPFYCPADQRVYIDLGFYRELQQRFGAPGDFAQAYVLAHEIGHHVQTLTGTERQVRQAQGGNPSQANALSVRMELQADCYAGVWAHTTSRRGLLEGDDVEEALNAASAIGDDRIQRMGSGRVAPERFTHGSSAQRMEWFRRGFETGQPAACDTFK